ncbi:hypothetical protein Enr13x_64180 [Stieleria neptunia]|uniref:Uncharacterized protein n=1 Tax=Stieleria neptunia TaxID=2527979 RepID=A0A518I079_9BACT|nr:hypothetical protein [Stieleria neptunia]QDV46509.1 hypothetical protein Enr13x_64180 [Stieleria neptunia]
MRYAILLSTLLITSITTTSATSPTGWSPIILPTGDYRTKIKSMPIEQRPGRLLHVYGNTVRLLDQSSRGIATRPIQQIFLGTTVRRTDGFRGN